MDNLVKQISEPLQLPYNPSISLKTGKFKILPGSGTRIYLIVKNRQLVEVLDSKLKPFNEKTRTALILKVNVFLEPSIKVNSCLDSNFYIFDALLTTHALTIIDLLFANDESLLEIIYAERLRVLAMLNISSLKVNVPDPEPTTGFEICENRSNVIIRDLTTFQIYTKEYRLAANENLVNYVIVGEGLQKNDCKINLPHEPYTKLSNLSDRLKTQLIQLAKNPEEFRNSLESFKDEEKLAAFNELKQRYIESQNIKSTDEKVILHYTDYRKMFLVAAKDTVPGKLVIFGVCKTFNKADEILKTQKSSIQPPLVVWRNQKNVDQLHPDSILFYDRLFLVNCKRVDKYRGLLESVVQYSLISYYELLAVHGSENHQIFNEIAIGPEIQTTKTSNSVNLCSIEKLCNALWDKIHFQYLQNPNDPENQKAYDYINYLIQYNALLKERSQNLKDSIRRITS